MSSVAALPSTVDALPSTVDALPSTVDALPSTAPPLEQLLTVDPATQPVLFGPAIVPT